MDRNEGTALHHVVERVFAGQATSLVRRLLSTEDVGPEDLEAIRRLLAEKS